MFVCLNKVTCVRMYNYVQEYWKEEIKKLKAKIKKATQQEAQELERRLKWMQETEMAVVISQEQNEIQTFKKWDLDIKYHRAKMEKRELDKEFKDGVLIMSVYDFLLNEGKGDQTWDKSFMYPFFYILHQQYEKNK